jgi:peptidyl-prolyl cis-trans isomerase C
MKRTGMRGLFFVLAGFGLAVLPACQKAVSTGPVAAEVGNEKITLDDLKTRLQDAPPAYQQYVTSPEGRREFLNLMIREKVLLSEAKALGISSQPSYKEALRKYKDDMKRQLKLYEENLQVDSTLRALRAKDLAATDTEVEKYYNDHRADYENPKEILVSHILLSTEDDAKTALARLQAGESFDRVARSMSKDPGTAVHGGKLNPLRRGMLFPEFENAAFPLKVGQISGIVKSQFGFHIIKKLGEKQLPARSLAEAKEEIRTQLEREKFNQWVAAKQAAIGVKINDQAMSQLSVEEPPKP